MEQIKIKNYYYVIKVAHGRSVFYKIGETTKNDNRPRKLVEKYSALKAIDAEILAFEELPNNGVKRLNDKTIHNNLADFEHVDSNLLYRLFKGENDGIEEFFKPKQHINDAEVISYIKNIVVELGKDAKNFKAKVPMINNYILNYDGQLHKVTSNTISEINKFANLKLEKEENKNILLIGQFEPDWVATFALSNNVVILHDNKDQIHRYNYNNLNTHITYIYETGEINMNIKFDYIIANPPYAIGNQITKSVVDNVNFDNYINLMPLSCYKSQQLYKNVNKLELADPTAFEDAKITDNLCICELTKDEIENQTYEDLALVTYAPEYREFYKLNAGLNYTHGKFIKLINNEQLAKTFYISPRVCLDGVHSVGFDVKANYGELSIETLNEDASKKRTTAAIPLSSIEFRSNYEKENFRTFWYNNPLMNDLIKGLKKTGGNCSIAIPNIDYSIDRDYEHLTLDDIMRILKEENHL